jgi:hypothetical protein
MDVYLLGFSSFASLAALAALAVFSMGYYLLNNNTMYNTNYLDDVSKMNSMPIKYICHPNHMTDIINVVQKTTDKISIYGQKHSMGGHIVKKNGIAIDMTHINKIHNIDLQNQTITVGAGIIWSDIIKYLNKYGYSPMILQSYCSFSVGGSISVNAHGIISDDVLEKSIVQLKIIDTYGILHTCSRIINSELYSLVVGGYGLFGIIYEVTLKIIPNVNLKLLTMTHLNIDEFVSSYTKILKNPNVAAKLARINILDFDHIDLFIFIKSDSHIISNLSESSDTMSKVSRLLYKWIYPTKLGKMFRSYDINSNTTLNELIYESAQPLCELYSPLITLNVSHVLQEYFIPTRYIKSWMLYLKKYFGHNTYYKVNLLNITIRFIKQDSISFLKYARDKYMFAFVCYFRITNNDHGHNELKKINHDLVNIALQCKGTFYLPYCIHYTEEQIHKSYPNINQFIVHKKLYDKQNRLSNTWYEWINKISTNE